MTHRCTTDRFHVEYKENQIDSTMLWENHCHAQYEMISVLEGNIRVMLEGRSYRLTANQTAIIPPLCYHTVTANKSGLYRRVTVLFDAEAIPDALRPRFSQKDERLSIFFSRGTEEFKKICEARDPVYYAPLIQSLMIQLFYADVDAERTAPRHEVDATLSELLSYVDGHLCEKIHLDDLAAHVARSKSSVCHLFEEKMGISPKQYVLQKKLALAAKRIHDGTPPTVAAMEVGYDNYSNFYRMYRKHFGIIPTRDKR